MRSMALEMLFSSMVLALEEFNVETRNKVDKKMWNSYERTH